MAAGSVQAHRTFDKSDLRLLGLVRRLLKERRMRQQAEIQLKDTLLGLIHCMSSVIDAKDPCTCGHSERVARIEEALSRTK